jgi:tetratricopeptide (TPR) repeat protein
MTRSPRRPPRPPRAPAFALHGTAGVSAREARIEARLAWALAAGMAVALLAVALGPHRIGDYSTETDFYGGYAGGARMIQHGRIDPARYGVVGPGYEVALAAAGWVVRDLFTAAELISVGSAVATVMLWFALLRRRSNTRLALPAALFIAVNPHLFRFAYTASTDAFGLALSSAALYLLLATGGTRTAAAAGLVAAAAFLTRYTSVVLLPIGLVVAALGGRAPGLSLGRRAADPSSGSSRRREVLAFAVGFVFPVAAWLAFSFSRGAGFAFQLHHDLAFEVFGRPRGMGFDAYQRDVQPQFHTLWDVIARDPLAVARQLAVNCVTHVRDDARLLLGWPTAACTALGVALARRRALARGWPFVLAAGISFLALVPVFHSERYSLTLLPYYAAAAAFFFATPELALAVGRGMWLKPAFAVLPAALSVVASVDLQRRILAQQPTEALAAALSLRSLAHSGDRVIARKPHVAALAGVPAVAFPFADSLAGLGDYARREHARWLYFGFPEAEARPAFRYLLDTSAVVPGLTARHVTTGRPSVLYEIGPEFGALPAWFRNDTLVALHDARATALASPGDVRALRTAGSIELATGDLPRAHEHLERAADLAPNDVDLLLPLGETFLRLGDPELAARAYERAERVSPGNVQARIGRGWASLLAGREREAADLWRPVIGLTQNGPTLARMHALYLGLGDAAAAAEAEAALRRLERR